MLLQNPAPKLIVGHIKLYLCVKQVVKSNMSVTALTGNVKLTMLMGDLLLWRSVTKIVHLLVLLTIATQTLIYVQLTRGPRLDNMILSVSVKPGVKPSSVVTLQRDNVRLLPTEITTT